jgi:hypothetical protein
MKFLNIQSSKPTFKSVWLKVFICIIYCFTVQVICYVTRWYYESVLFDLVVVASYIFVL